MSLPPLTLLPRLDTPNLFVVLSDSQIHSTEGKNSFCFRKDFCCGFFWVLWLFLSEHQVHAQHCFLAGMIIFSLEVHCPHLLCLAGEMKHLPRLILVAVIPTLDHPLLGCFIFSCWIPVVQENVAAPKLEFAPRAAPLKQSLHIKNPKIKITVLPPSLGRFKAAHLPHVDVESDQGVFV